MGALTTGWLRRVRHRTWGVVAAVSVWGGVVVAAASPTCSGPLFAYWPGPVLAIPPIYCEMIIGPVCVRKNRSAAT